MSTFAETKCIRYQMLCFTKEWTRRCSSRNRLRTTATYRRPCCCPGSSSTRAAVQHRTASLLLSRPDDEFMDMILPFNCFSELRQNFDDYQTNTSIAHGRGSISTCVSMKTFRLPEPQTTIYPSCDEMMRGNQEP